MKLLLNKTALKGNVIGASVVYWSVEPVLHRLMFMVRGALGDIKLHKNLFVQNHLLDTFIHSDTIIPNKHRAKVIEVVKVTN